MTSDCTAEWRLIINRQMMTDSWRPMADDCSCGWTPKGNWLSWRLKNGRQWLIASGTFGFSQRMKTDKIPLTWRWDLYGLVMRATSSSCALEQSLANPFMSNIHLEFFVLECITECLRNWYVETLMSLADVIAVGTDGGVHTYTTILKRYAIVAEFAETLVRSFTSELNDWTDGT